MLAQSQPGLGEVKENVISHFLPVLSPVNGDCISLCANPQTPALLSCQLTEPTQDASEAAACGLHHHA
jgi:hypothetical protein